MTTRNSRHLVDPQLQPFLDLLPASELSDETLPEVRARDWPLPVDPDLDAKVITQSFSAPGPAGAPPVGVVCYRPKAATGALRCIVHIHGGGYVSGKVSAQASQHKSMVLELDCAIVTVDYRLAPETPFPGPVEDCYAALAWLHANAGAPGVDLGRLGVMGESAGGGLAAALALVARDRGEYRLGFQHLIYPMLDDRTSVGPETERHPYAGEFVWTHANNLFGWASLLGHAPGRDGVSPYAAPARATNLDGLPPTFLSTGALDLFLEEDLDYARRLSRAGVPVELHVYPGGVHAFDFLPGIEVSERAARDSRAALKRALHRT